MKNCVDNDDIENMLRILDGFAGSGESRLTVTSTDELPQGTTQKLYHHGRCDVGSPWARGLAFDVLEEEPLSKMEEYDEPGV